MRIFFIFFISLKEDTTNSSNNYTNGIVKDFILKEYEPGNKRIIIDNYKNALTNEILINDGWKGIYFKNLPDDLNELLSNIKDEELKELTEMLFEVCKIRKTRLE